MAAVAAEYEGRVTFLGVPGGGDVPAMQEFVGDTGTGSLIHVVDGDGTLWQRFGVVSEPAFAFVGADGTTSTATGGMDEDALRDAVDELLDAG